MTFSYSARRLHAQKLAATACDENQRQLQRTRTKGRTAEKRKKRNGEDAQLRKACIVIYSLLYEDRH
jgi:hypothetical protein